MEGFPPGPYGKGIKYEYSIFIVIWTAPFLEKNKKKVPAGWLSSPRARSNYDHVPWEGKNGDRLGSCSRGRAAFNRTTAGFLSFLWPCLPTLPNPGPGARNS